MAKPAKSYIFESWIEQALTKYFLLQRVKNISNCSFIDVTKFSPRQGIPSLLVASPFVRLFQGLKIETNILTIQPISQNNLKHKHLIVILIFIQNIINNPQNQYRSLVCEVSISKLLEVFRRKDKVLKLIEDLIQTQFLLNFKKYSLQFSILDDCRQIDKNNNYFEIWEKIRAKSITIRLNEYFACLIASSQKFFSLTEKELVRCFKTNQFRAFYYLAKRALREASPNFILNITGLIEKARLLKISRNRLQQLFHENL